MNTILQEFSCFVMPFTGHESFGINRSTLGAIAETGPEVKENRIILISWRVQVRAKDSLSQE